MKKYLVTLFVVAFVGCATVTPEAFNQRLELLSEEATKELLIEKPQWREDFELVSKNLAILSTKDTISVDQVIEVVKTLKINELKSREARLSFAGAKIVFLNGVNSYELKTGDKLRQSVLAIRNGIEKGLL